MIIIRSYAYEMNIIIQSSKNSVIHLEAIAYRTLALFYVETFAFILSYEVR